MVVPLITEERMTFSRIRMRMSRKRNDFTAKMTGRFASPSRMKGRGLGMAYSTDERKRQSEAKKASVPPGMDRLTGLEEVGVA